MPQREPMTIRFPDELLGEMKQLKRMGESLNDLVVSAVEDEIRRRRALTVLDGIETIRQETRARYGVSPSSVAMIRELREGIGRLD